jgi:uncharacterized membrane protein YccC
MSVDFHYKLAVGLARFGQAARARSSFHSGLELAERHRLNDWYFKIEQAIGEQAERRDQSHRQQASELSEAAVVREMELGLREYAVATAP